jgi:hypothetical protein
MKNMKNESKYFPKKKRHLASLFVFWFIMVAVDAIFAYVLYTDGIKYPAALVGPERLRDAMYGIYAIVFVTFIVCVVWFFVWKAYRKNQETFDAALTEQEKSVPHSLADSSLPLSLHGNSLRINLGFSTETIDIGTVFWIHTRKRLLSRYGPPGLLLYLYKHNGEKKTCALFSHANAAGVYGIIGEVKSKRPNILVSRGFLSAEYKECRLRYKSRMS